MCKVSSSERPASPRRVLLCRRELETLHVSECSCTVGPPDGGSLTPRFVKQLMGVLVNERSQMHKRSTCLSSIHAPRMANSSLSSYIIKSPPIAEKARSPGIAFCAWPPVMRQTSTPHSSLCAYFCPPKTRYIPSAIHIDGPPGVHATEVTSSSFSKIWLCSEDTAWLSPASRDC